MLRKFFYMVAILGRWSYGLIFLATFLESSALTGLLVPGETVVVFSGFLASRNYLDLGDCIWVASLGAILGDSAGYFLGQRLGLDYFQDHGSFLLLRKENVEEAHSYLLKHGGKAVFFGRFVSVLRSVVPFIAGLSRMPYRTFLLFNVAGALLWSVSFILLGYFFGESWILIEKWVGRVGLIILIFLLAGLISAHFYRTIHPRR